MEDKIRFLQNITDKEIELNKEEQKTWLYDELIDLIFTNEKNINVRLDAIAMVEDVAMRERLYLHYISKLSSQAFTVSWIDSLKTGR